MAGAMNPPAGYGETVNVWSWCPCRSYLVKLASGALGWPLTYTLPRESATQWMAVPVEPQFDARRLPEPSKRPTPGTMRWAPDGSKHNPLAPEVPGTVCTRSPVGVNSCTL